MKSQLRSLRSLPIIGSRNIITVIITFELINQETTQEEGGMLKGIERSVVVVESAVAPAVPAALAAPLLQAAPAGLTAAAVAPAPRKQRSRPFNIPRS